MTQTQINGSVRSVAVDGGVLTDAARRFADERPGDVRYPTPEAFVDAMRAVKARAAEAIVDLADLRAEVDGGDLVIVGRTGNAARTTHASLSQLCTQAGVPSGFLRKLPAKLAADVLTDRLRAAAPTAEDGGKALALFSRHASGVVLRGVTGPDYGRVWQADLAVLAAEVAARYGFTAPIAFKSAARDAGGQGPTPMGDQHGLHCAVAGDRDAFIFLMDYRTPIRVPGYADPLFRGFFLTNSETGYGDRVAVTWTGFLGDGVCCNYNVWGVTGATEIRIRHTSGVHSRLPDLFAHARALAASNAADDEARILACQSKILAPTTEAATAALFGMRLPGVTKTIAEAAVKVAVETPRYGDPRSAWAIGNGLTEVSQRETHAGTRAEIDRSAGKVFRMAF